MRFAGRHQYTDMEKEMGIKTAKTLSESIKAIADANEGLQGPDWLCQHLWLCSINLTGLEQIIDRLTMLERNGRYIEKHFNERERADITEAFFQSKAPIADIVEMFDVVSVKTRVVKSVEDYFERMRNDLNVYGRHLSEINDRVDLAVIKHRATRARSSKKRGG
jgi:hypothetical protein